MVSEIVRRNSTTIDDSPFTIYPLIANLDEQPDAVHMITVSVTRQKGPSQ
jgi:hypothetical protein